MNHSQQPARSEPGTSEEFAESPPSPDAGPGPSSAPPQPDRRPDKEGGAPVDELDLDGDGSRRQ